MSIIQLKPNLLIYICTVEVHDVRRSCCPSGRYYNTSTRSEIGCSSPLLTYMYATPTHGASIKIAGRSWSELMPHSERRKFHTKQFKVCTMNREKFLCFKWDPWYSRGTPSIHRNRLTQYQLQFDWQMASAYAGFSNS